MIVPQKMKAKLAERLDYNERYSHYRFEMVSPFKMNNLAGQYVMIDVGQGQKRAYSMCDRPDIDSSFELLVDHRPGGIGTTYLKNLAFGQVVDLIAPLGDLVVNESAADAKMMVLLAGGCEIAPFRAILTDQLQIKNDQRSWLLLWAMEDDRQLFWEDDLMLIDKSFPNFKLVPIIAQPSANWQGQTGLITDFVANFSFPEPSQFYFCACPALVEELKKILVKKGVPAERMVSEKFTHCG